MIKKRIIVPSGFYTRTRNTIIIKNTNDVKNEALADVNTQYIFNIEGKATDSENSKTIMAGGFFNTLKPKGDVIINIKNIKNFSFDRNIDKSSTYNEFECGDYLDFPSLTINTPDNLYLCIEKIGISHDTMKLKELNVSANELELQLEQLPNIEKITFLSQYDANKSHIKLNHLPKLKAIDLSRLSQIKANDFDIDHIPKNTQIILNKDLVIHYEWHSPMFESPFNNFGNYYDKIKNINLCEDKKLKISDLFPEQKNSPFVVSYEELTKRLFKYDLEDTIGYCQKFINKKLKTDNNKTTTITTTEKERKICKK